MGKYPDLSAAAQALPASIFSRLYERLARFEGEVIRFQIGDTHVPPPAAGRLGALGFSADPDPELYSYSPPHGDAGLLGAVVAKLTERNHLGFVTADHVQITSGATHALSCCARAVLDPGDEILLLAPYWPLIRNIALSCCVQPVEVVFSHHLLRSEPPRGEIAAAVAALVEPHITERTAALYLCTPNNPDGMVHGPEVLGAIAELAERRDLWVLSDEVYEEFTYDGRTHTSIAGLPGMAGRTLTTFSFSKSYAQAGLRVGYAVGPPAVMSAVRRMANASVYSVPAAMQRAALRALDSGDRFLADTRARYQKARDRALARIQAPCLEPQGSTYLFLDLSEWIGDEHRTALCLLEKLADAGLLLAPGAAFGAAFANWARLCFTSVDAETLDEGIDRLNRVLDAARPRR